MLAGNEAENQTANQTAQVAKIEAVTAVIGEILKSSDRISQEACWKLVDTLSGKSFSDGLNLISQGIYLTCPEEAFAILLCLHPDLSAEDMNQALKSNENVEFDPDKVKAQGAVIGKLLEISDRVDLIDCVELLNTLNGKGFSEGLSLISQGKWSCYHEEAFGILLSVHPNLSADEMIEAFESTNMLLRIAQLWDLVPNKAGACFRIEFLATLAFLNIRQDLYGPLLQYARKLVTENPRVLEAGSSFSSATDVVLKREFALLALKIGLDDEPGSTKNTNLEFAKEIYRRIPEDEVTLATFAELLDKAPDLPKTKECLINACLQQYTPEGFPQAAATLKRISDFFEYIKGQEARREYPVTMFAQVPEPASAERSPSPH